MPGARLMSFRSGDRAELLAECCLNTIAFTTRIPRQEDIGYDLFCVLAESDGRLVQAGPFFTVQVKSNVEPLVFKKKHERNWVSHIENPFFLAVVDIHNLKIDIYSTWARLKGQLEIGAEQIEFRPGPPDPGEKDVWMDNDKRQVICLGDPVISATAGKLIKDDEYAKSLSRVLNQWIELDRENIVNSHADVHWILGPSSYQTNKELDCTQRSCWIYWNEKNLDRCQINFGRAATALRLTLVRALDAKGRRTKNHAKKMAALDAAILTHWDYLDAVSRDALKLHIGPPFSEQE